MSLEYSLAHPWIEGAELLSLDLTRPYYRYLGVGIPSFELLQGLARRALSGDPAGTQYLPPETLSEPYLSQYERSIVPMIRSVEEMWGEDGRACLEHWVMHILPRTESPWKHYADSFSEWSSRFRRIAEDTIGFSSDARTISDHYSDLVIDACDIDDLETRYVGAPLSPWDYAVCHLGAHREYTEFYSRPPFYDSLALAVRMNGFQSFWRWLLGYSGPADLDAVAAKLTVRELHSDSSLAKPETHGFWGLVLEAARSDQRDVFLHAIAAAEATSSERFTLPTELPLPPPPVA